MSDPADEIDPRSFTLLRFLAAGLNDDEIAAGLYGSHGFMDTLKRHAIRTFAVKNEEGLRAFANDWVLLNPLPQQPVLEVERPHPELSSFYVFQSMQKVEGGSRYAKHSVYLYPEHANDPEQVKLLEDYLQRIVIHHLEFNFTGGSTIEGRPAPGWSALRKYYPRRVLFGVAKSETELGTCMQLSYGSDTAVVHPRMVSALYSWLNAQFEVYASTILLRGGLHKLIHIEASGKRPVDH